MDRKVIALLACFLLAGCSAGEVIVVEPPKDPDIHVTGYQVVPRFSGFELTLGIPALAPIPIIGPSLAEAIRLRAGNSDTIIVPVLREDEFIHAAKVAAARARLQLPADQPRP